MTDECITIDSSGEDDVQIMDLDTPVVQAKPNLSDEVKRKVTLQTVETGKSIFTAFLTTCKNTDSSKEMDIIVNKMWKRFHAAESSYTSSAKFIEFVKTLFTKASKEPYCTLKSVSDDLRFHTIKAENSKVESVEPGPSTSSNCDENNRKILRTIEKLEKVVAKLQKKINHLEKQEVDLNDSSDEENSAYIQVCRYKKRMCDVYKKICELRKTDSFDNCLLGNIKFSGTKISAVNRAIEKFYNETREFPDFAQVLAIVEKANNIKNLRLLPVQCHETAVQAFKELGETLKRKRQFEFHDSLSSYIGSNESDPASENQILEERLQENQKLYGNRIDEIIDKYAKRQIEEKLEPDVVIDDAASETAAEDDELEEEEDASSIAEVESNADYSSADEDHEKDDTDVDANQEKSFEARDFKIVIPNVQQTPEWAVYRKAGPASHSGRGCAGIVCQPVPGCSKDIVDDFCIPCSYKTPSVTKRSHSLVSDDGKDDDEIGSRPKVGKADRPLISVDLTEDSQLKKPATQGAKLLPISVNLVDEDPLTSERASCSQVTNGIIDESTESSVSECASFVVVDVESILAKKTAKIPKLMRNKARNGGKLFGKALSSNTKSVVTHKDAAEDVSVSDPGLKDQLKTLSKNGIKIVNVSSKDASSTPSADDESDVSTNHAKSGSEGETISKRSSVKNRSEIVDLEEVACQGKAVSDTVTKLVKNSEPKSYSSSFSKAVSSTSHPNSKPLFFRSSSYQETKKPEDNIPPWRKPSPNGNRFPFTSTPKPSSTYQPSSSSQSGFQMPSSHRSNFSPRSYPGSQRRPNSQPQFGGSFAPNRNMRVGPLPPHPHIAYTAPRPAMAKRTVQTTQQIVNGSNIYMQTTTVVQEVQMQSNDAGVRNPFLSNRPVGRGGGSNRGFGGASGSRGAPRPSSFASKHNGGVSQDPRQRTNRKNSADVITLE